MARVIGRLLASSALLVFFFVVSSWAFWTLSGALLPQFGPGVRTEALTNVILGVLFPYSSVLFGYLSGKFCKDAQSQWEPHLSNAFLYVCTILLVIFEFRGSIYFIGLAVLSAFVARATNLERPAPRMAIKVDELDTRFTAPDSRSSDRDHWHSDASPHRDRIAALVPVMIAILLLSAPIASVVFFIFLGSMLSSFIFAFFSPSRGPETDVTMQLTSSGLTWGALVLPTFATSILLLRPSIFIFNMTRRLTSSRYISKGQKRGVYLRRFVFDRRKHLWQRRLWYDLLHSVPGLGSSIEYAMRVTLEYRLMLSLHDVASFVAVGRPNELIRPLGAHRMYISDSEWQGRVSALLQEADINLVVVDASEAIKWEVSQALAPRNQTRTVLILPEPKRSEAWYRFWGVVRSENPALPNVDDDVAVITFASDATRVTRVTGRWNSWGDAVVAAFVYGISKTAVNGWTIEFGPRVRGSKILLIATVIVCASFLLGYVIPLLGIDLLEYLKIDVMYYAIMAFQYFYPDMPQ